MIKRTVFVVCAFLLCAACQPAVVTNKNVVAPAQATPIPPEAVRIEKATNVIFNTYSKEWPKGWQWIDPDEKYAPTPHDYTMGVLRVRIPTHKDLYGENRTAPRFVKPLTGDFAIETRVKFYPSEDYQGAGLLIFLDGNNYIRFERAFGGLGGGGRGIRLDFRSGDDYKPIVTPASISTDAPQVDLKLVRTGPTVSAFWREPDGEWQSVGEIAAGYPDTVLAGIVACNTARETTAEFAYIKLYANPPRTK